MTIEESPTCPMYSLFPRTKITLAVQPFFEKSESCFSLLTMLYLMYWSYQRMFWPIYRHDSTCHYDMKENLFESLLKSVYHWNSPTRNHLVREYVDKDVVGQIQLLLFHHDHQIYQNTLMISDFLYPMDSNVEEQWRMYPLK